MALVSGIITFRGNDINIDMFRVRKRSIPFIKRCNASLNSSGLCSKELVCFIREDDGFYHLQVDGVDYGFLDYSNSDSEFKGMLTYIIKDLGFMADVIILPCRGRELVDCSLVGVFRDRRSFYESFGGLL